MSLVRQGPPAKESPLLPREWDPFRTMRDLFRWDPFREMVPLATGFVPNVDVSETPTEYVFKADVPGMKEKDLEISVTGNRLTLTGKREEEKKTEKDTYYAMERSYGSFSRTFTLPNDIEVGTVRADLAEGVLTITIPKKAESKPQRVPVQQAPEPPPAPVAKA